MLYAQDKWALLLIFQAMDAAGKDGAIKHVMSGVNPQGCQVFSFKSPSAEDLDHDYLWRCVKCLPNRGHIGIFNRSYYEETLVVRVHPEFLAKRPSVDLVARRFLRYLRFFWPLMPWITPHKFASNLRVETLPKSSKVCRRLYRAMIWSQEMNNERCFVRADLWSVLHSEEILRRDEIHGGLPSS